MTIPTGDRKPTTATATGSSVAPSKPPDASALPVGRAFLVQLAGDCDPAEQAVRGRVEHVRSGEATRFQSLPELVEFMLGVLRQLREGAG